MRQEKTQNYPNLRNSFMLKWNRNLQKRLRKKYEEKTNVYFIYLKLGILW